MSQIEPVSPQIKFKTKELQQAVATQRSIQAISYRLPSFVHKWSREIENYQRKHLELPKILFSSNINYHLLNQRIVVGIGGTRSPTVETFCFVCDFCKELAENNCLVISGGVPGVDLAGHCGALNSQAGTTIAAMANPPAFGFCGHGWSCDPVKTALSTSGCFLSEYSEFEKVNSAVFNERLLQRDRIISGLSHVFVAFECTDFSATVDTATRALLQGKLVYVIHPESTSTRRGSFTLAKALKDIYPDKVTEFQQQKGKEVELARSVISKC